MRLIRETEQGEHESVCASTDLRLGALGREGPEAGFTTFLTAERPSKSPSQMSRSTRTHGIVSPPCHALASLKYSFWAPVRYGHRVGRKSVGGFRHVIQTEDGNPVSVPTRRTVEYGGPDTMKLGTDAFSREGLDEGGTDANRSG